MVRQLVTEGDSLTAGLAVANFANYPNQALSLVGVTKWTLWNVGVGGSNIGLVSSRAAAVDALHRARYADNCLVLWIGSNDVAASGVSLSALQSSIQSYCTARRSAGWKVLIATILPRDPVFNSNGSFETDRGSMNTWIRNSTGSFRDGLVDIAGDNRIGDATDYSDTTYFADGLHMTATGYGIVAAALQSALVALLGSNP
jgi:lysophospholipase L1-like esterase